MKHRRIPKRKAAIAGGAVVALVGAGLTFQSANASDNTEQFTAKKLSATAAGNLANTLSVKLGGDAAGTYYDADAKTLIVNVIDDAAAKAVRDAGGKARVVENTLAELKTARQTLTTKATIPGTSWAVNPVTNKVVVTADRTVKGAALTKLNQVVKGLGGKAELKKTAGEFKPFISGGDAIHSGGGRCSLGFNVVKDGEPHFIESDGRLRARAPRRPGHSITSDVRPGPYPVMKPMQIAIDAMGGDHAPGFIVSGSLAAARQFGFGRHQLRRGLGADPPQILGKAFERMSARYSPSVSFSDASSCASGHGAASGSGIGPDAVPSSVPPKNDGWPCSRNR